MVDVSVVTPALPRSYPDVDDADPPDDPNLIIMFLQDPDLTTLLSAFEIPTHPPSSELSTLLTAALGSVDSEAEDSVPLKKARMSNLGRLHEFKHLHGDIVAKMWALARHAKQWHTWGLEAQYLYARRGYAGLSPELLSSQDKLFTFVNGFKVLAFQLMQQQKGFNPPENENASSASVS